MYNCKYCGMETKNIGSLIRHQNSCKLIILIQDELILKYRNGGTVPELSKCYHIGKDVCKRILTDAGIYRSIKEARALSHKKYPNAHKHTVESKSKLRECRLAWMKLNPEKTAWRTRNEPSYPEKLFMKICSENSLYDKYDIIREYCVFPHYVDFAFINAKVAIEVDGSQHWLNIARIEADIKKDDNLRKNGWRVMHIPEFKLKNSYAQVTYDVLDFLSDVSITEKQYAPDIIEYEHLRHKRNQKSKIANTLRRNERTAQSNALKNKRHADFISVYPLWGWSTSLGTKWGLSSQAASRYCHKYFITKEQ